jgi:hypothetical protein
MGAKQLLTPVKVIKLYPRPFCRGINIVATSMCISLAIGHSLWQSARRYAGVCGLFWGRLDLAVVPVARITGKPVLRTSRCRTAKCEHTKMRSTVLVSTPSETLVFWDGFLFNTGSLNLACLQHAAQPPRDSIIAAVDRKTRTASTRIHAKRRIHSPKGANLEIIAILVSRRQHRADLLLATHRVFSIHRHRHSPLAATRAS